MYGDRLRKLRLSKELTMEQVGLRLGIAKSSYAGYETESRQPPIDKLMKLAKIYGVSVDYIIGLTDDSDPKKERKDLKELLSNQGLLYKGVPLDDNTVKVIKDVLELIASSKEK